MEATAQKITPTRRITSIRQMKRGKVFYVDFGETKGSEQGGIRPGVIIQNDIGNRYSPTVIVAAITSQVNKAKLPTHEEVGGGRLRKDSTVLLEQIRTVDKIRVKEYLCDLTDEEMVNVDKALMISLGLHN